MPLRHFRKQYEQLSQFERGRVIDMMEAGWSARRLGSGCPRQSSHQEDHHHIVRNARIQPTASSVVIQAQAAEWNQVVFSDESRFNLSSDDNLVHVWRPRDERLNPAFALQRRTAPTADMMVWDVIAYNTRSPLVLIRCAMAAQRYVYDILQPHVQLQPLMQWLPGAIFLQGNAKPHTQGCYNIVSALLLTFLGLSDPQICFQTSISGIIWVGMLGIPLVWTN
ncbi:transposable element Tcb2 transposase [Trichonephila clavipes]|nr:transposable element Tcb2 transposase [Trichonephila clavipes]